MDRLAFPDGTLAQPDHPLPSRVNPPVTRLYTTTTIGVFRWTYLVLLNLSEEAQGYSLDLEPFLEDKEKLVYDYLAGQSMRQRQVVGSARSGEIHLVLPRVGGLHLLGFLDKYVTLSGRQVKGIQVEQERVEIDWELPAGRSYTLTVLSANNLAIEGGA